MNQQPPGSEPIIVAMANAADRRNRPTAWVVVSVVLLIAGLIYGLSGWRTYTSGQQRLAVQYNQDGAANRLIRNITTRSESRPDLKERFGSGSFMANHVQRAATRVWNVVGDDLPQGVTIPGTPMERRLEGQSDLKQLNLECRLINQPLETIFQFIEEVLAAERLENAFVSRLVLQPATEGWTATIEFRQYAYVGDNRS